MVGSKRLLRHGLDITSLRFGVHRVVVKLPATAEDMDRTLSAYIMQAKIQC
jgi:hypothetical protein